MVRASLLFAVGAVTVLIAAGCGGSSHSGTTTDSAGTYPVVVVHPHASAHGVPSSVLQRVSGHKAALFAPSSVAFMTSATAKCAWWPTQLTVHGPSSVRVDMRINGVPATCGTGATAFPIAVKLPSAVDVHTPVTFQFAYKVRLPGNGGTKRFGYKSVAPALSRP